MVVMHIEGDSEAVVMHIEGDSEAVVSVGSYVAV